MSSSPPAERGEPPASAAGSAQLLSDQLEALERRRGYNAADTLGTARTIEVTARSLGEVELQQRARLLQGDMLDRRGDVGGGAKLVWSVNRWAADSGNRPLLARSHLLLATAYHNLGEASAALEHAVLSVDLLDESTHPRVRAQHLTKLGDALGWVGSPDAARARYLEAELIAIALDDVEMQVRLLNNLAYTEYEAGEHEHAWDVAQHMLELARRHDEPLNAMLLDTVARTQIARGMFTEAQETMRQALLQLEGSGAGRYDEADSLGEFLLTLAEAQRLGDDLEGALSSVARSIEVADERRLGEVKAKALEQLSEIHAAQRDFRAAFETHKAFHQQSEDLRSLGAESAARSRHVMFETAEAQRAALRFREQALRDPLTGLHNRRFVDEQLPLVLHRTAEAAQPLSVGLVDLDHFKQVNDTLSHETGDRVLVTMAALFSEVLAGWTSPDPESVPFVARIGGEEFLVVIPGIGQHEAVNMLDDLRLVVGRRDWELGGLRQTVSIGVASSAPGCTQAQLLRSADDSLYVAKRSGRDRVVAATTSRLAVEDSSDVREGQSGRRRRRRIRR